MPAARPWLVETVRAYRELAFFEGRVDRGAVRWDLPGFTDLEEGYPLPAWGTMAPEQVADRILTDWPARWGGAPDPADPAAEEVVLQYDVDRVLHLDTECIEPGGDAYAKLLPVLARVSRGAFAPRQVHEAWEEGEDGPATLRFTHAGQPREVLLENLGDYADLGLLEAVNLMLAPSPLRFCVRQPEGQDVTILALTRAERERLERERGWDFAEQPELRAWR